jgi:hypothetical protein
MLPNTIHFLATVIRHHRGLCTAAEKWARETPRELFSEEHSSAMAFIRETLTEIETRLSEQPLDEQAINNVFPRHAASAASRVPQRDADARVGVR